jgi:hypothetical protein
MLDRHAARDSRDRRYIRRYVIRARFVTRTQRFREKFTVHFPQISAGVPPLWRQPWIRICRIESDALALDVGKSPCSDCRRSDQEDRYGARWPAPAMRVEYPEFDPLTVSA